ncbi:MULTISPECIES: LacI family DNA-binding transcriptional regulator [unclassified Microbacterium]|uniref:LacI family DNA-binding transcriptional regulator n=1 Tax=unclassified Microbacterium TaxID=2609290 RepID=UPI000EA847AE|nr:MULTISPECIES: LacI family DNA-binding transcriptional regulator [unclassified Microbacterium]MBT2486560.1 LacI family DNA-binding transcriptional regulator [Microbacterium sp. ISL-108]RKN69249.1 LacI family transcriptional regulator [Microbacterium sp. CGR2]
MSRDEPNASDEPVATEGRAGRRPTIYDIAQKVGLNPSTVSRALNKPGRTNAATEEKIRAAAGELGYRVNPMARSLPTGLTGTFAIVLPDITNPVHFELIRGAEQVARASGFTLIVSETEASAELELETIETLQPSVDGLLVVASRLADEELAALAREKPIVAANHSAPSLPSVIPHLVMGLTAAMDHLHDLGHRSVAYLGLGDIQINRARWDLTLDLATTRGISAVEITVDAPTVAAGADALRRVRASGVTAVLAYNDLVAHGLLRAARSGGVQLPESFSVIGFDDIFSAELAAPALTTLRSPLREIGTRAMQTLIDPERNRVASKVVLPLELVVRESTAAPRT